MIDTYREALIAYFKEEITAEKLATELPVFDQFSKTIEISDNKDRQFELKPKHILQICRDFLRNHLKAEDIESLSFILISDTFFFWNNEFINEILSDWSAPTVHGAITPALVRSTEKKLESM